jgi:membrane protease YdiL (CAAX protease family)
VRPESRVVAYVQQITVAWGLFAYVTFVPRRRGTLEGLLGRRWQTWRQAAADLALAAIGWRLLAVSELGWATVFQSAVPTSVDAMLPHGPLEQVVWVVLSVSVALSEEVVFRGYLATQLTGFTGRVGVANLLQAALFGLAHAEQGSGAVVRLAAYGWAFGALARWRRGLSAGIVCHAWTNLASGLLRS